MLEWQQFVSDFHFLRPWWLLAFPLGVALLWLGRKRMAMGDWAKAIDPRWLPFMVESSGDSPRRLWPWVFSLICAATALAGPSWQQLPQPLHQQQSALVILLDLSPSMLSEDLKPNRITRARYKLRDILEQRKAGQTALIVYGGSAHVVTPLTDDNATIISQLAVLDPNLMSTPGSNTEAAVDLAKTILDNGGIQSADLLLVSDGVASAASSYIGKELIGTNLRLSVLGVGTDQGAPIPLADGSFAKDSGGNIVMPRLDRTPLLELARRHSGQYSDLSADNSDLERLLTHMNAPLQSLNTQHKQLDRNFDSWHDQGYWLALLLLPLVVLAFRKGLVACLLLAPILVSQPSSGEEQQVEKTITSQLPNFLKTPDQRGQQAFQQQQFDAARQQFSSPQWRGSAAYRQGDYQAALEAFQQDNSANGLYNQGNALARLGEFDKAIEAYDKALEKDPDLQDAAANKELLEQLKQQQQNQQGEDHQKGQDQSDSNSEQQNSESENPESENSEQESQQNSQQESQQNSQPDQQQDSQQQNSDQSQNENQQPEDGSEDQQQQSPEPGEQEQQEKDEQQPSQGASQQNSDEEAEQAMEQFLRKVPDDPGAFLREKFRRQQQRQKRQPQPERW